MFPATQRTAAQQSAEKVVMVTWGPKQHNDQPKPAAKRSTGSRGAATEYRKMFMDMKCSS